MDISQLIHLYGEHRKTILIVGANVLGLLIIWGFVSLINRAATGTVPSVEAPPQAIVSYMASQQFQNQSSADKLQFATNVFNRNIGSHETIDSICREVDKLSDYQAMQLRDNFVDVAVEQAVQDSQIYYKLSPDQKKAFINQRIQTMRGFQSLITGQPIGGGGGLQRVGQKGFANGSGRNIAANPKLSRDIPQNAPGMYKMLVDKTKPGDRAKIEGYIGDLQNTIKAQKATERARSGR